MNQFTKTFRKVQKQHAEVCESKGFFDSPVDPIRLLALIHSEVSELLAVYRAQSFCLTHAEEELADIILRSMDFATRNNLDLAEAVLNKIEKNKDRKYLHGKRF